MLADITAALRRGDHAAAIAAAHAAIAAEPENAQAHHLLGVALQRSGDIAGARAAVDRAIGIAPDRSMFQLSRAALALGEQDLALAEQGMKEALALDPNQLPAYVALVHMALAQGRNDEAAQHLKLAQRVDPEHPHVLVAEGHVAQLSGQAEHALKCFTAAAAVDPRYPLAQVSLGLTYLQRGLWAFAEQALNNAVALDAGNPGVLRALVEVYRRQDKIAEAIAVLDRLVALRADAAGLAIRGQLHLQAGQFDAALADILVALELQPAHSALLNAAANLLIRSGRADEVLALSERALASANRDDVWTLRLGLTGHSADLTREVLERWKQALPDSAMCLDRWAHYYEALGDTEKAREYAERALAKSPNTPSSQILLVRADVMANPAQALKRLEGLASAARSTEAWRMVLGWRGLAEDHLKRFSDAAESFRQLVTHVPQQTQLPTPMGADGAPEGLADGILLWAPAGVRMERVLQSLHPLLQGRLLAERVGSDAREDGFGLSRALPGRPEAGSASKWREAIEAQGLSPAVVVDWLPHYDAYTAAALRGARTVAVLCDPRDAFLNWLVYGSAQGYLFNPSTERSAGWLALTLEALTDHRDALPDQVTIVRIDAIDEAPAVVASELQAALGLSEAPSAEVLGHAPKALGGLPNQFPAGHWRNYRDAFAAEFARLAPVAQRLGYPAE